MTTEYFTEICQKTDSLSRVKPTGLNFVTCYLDFTKGRFQARQAFRKIQSKYRKVITENSLKDYDSAVKMIDTYLESVADRKRSVVIFSRGILGKQYFLTIPLSYHVKEGIYLRTRPVLKGLQYLIESLCEKKITVSSKAARYNALISSVKNRKLKTAFKQSINAGNLYSIGIYA